MGGHPRELVVEDNDIGRAVMGLGKRRVRDWPDAEPYLVRIRVLRGVKQVLDHDTLAALLKEEGREALGIVVDADDAFDSRWDRIQGFAHKHFHSVPKGMPKEGLILEGSDGKRFGAWIMPDNESEGMVEDFCRTLIPDKLSPLWTFAQQAAREAKAKHGADYKSAHVPKANIRTWLAWRDPPGERVDVAIAKGMLDPGAEAATSFVSWLKGLYRLELAP